MRANELLVYITNYSTDLHYKDPYVQEWDITVERELGSGVGLRASYDGNHGSNLGVLDNLNQISANTKGFAAANAVLVISATSRRLRWMVRPSFGCHYETNVIL